MTDQAAAVSSRATGTGDHPTIWHGLAVGGTVAAAALITLTSGIDRCADPRSFALIVSAWLIAPIVAIASTAAVASTTTDRGERAVTVAVALAMTVGWLYAIHWMSLGTAIAGIGC